MGFKNAPNDHCSERLVTSWTGFTHSGKTIRAPDELVVVDEGRVGENTAPSRDQGRRCPGSKLPRRRERRDRIAHWYRLRKWL